jgi:hypothetical protein
MYKELTIKTELSEITIDEFYLISEISLNKNLSEIEKNIEILTILGGEDVDDMPIDIFSDIMKSINFNLTPEHKIQDVIELDGVTLKLKGNTNDFKFSVKQIMKIKKHMETTNLKYIHKMIQEVYDVTTSIEDIDDYIKHNITMDIATPFILELQKKYK